MKTAVFVFLLLFSTLTALPSVNEMTLEEKVGQLFMAYFEGDTANENAKRLIQEAKVGGIIYYTWANELKDAEKIQKMSRDLQKLAEIPLFIAADQEGGIVSRFDDVMTEFPSNAALCASQTTCQDYDLTYYNAYYLGKELKTLGVNFNLSPVVDINSNPHNPIIGIRAFSHDKQKVLEHAKKTINGLKDAGVLSCLKHFPGHGDTHVDSHFGLPISEKTCDELEALELYPFMNLIDDAECIMTAHILFPKIDPTACATLSHHFLQTILRDRLGFSGVVVSDSLTMQGVLEKEQTVTNAAIKALKAGCDILLIGGRTLQNQTNKEKSVDEILDMYHAIVEAVKKGIIPESQIDASVTRILQLKQTLNCEVETEKQIHCKEHTQLARQVAYRSVLIDSFNLPYDLSQLDIAIICPKLLEEKIRKTDLEEIGRSVTFFPFAGCNLNDTEFCEIVEKVNSAQYVIFCGYNLYKSPKQQELLSYICKKMPTAFIATKDPCDASLAKSADIVFTTHGPTIAAMQVVADWLKMKPKPFEISYQEAECIGQKVWFNECRNRIDQLTFWNENEPFPSMGIGHFIWPPKQYERTFSSGSFHAVVEFLDSMQQDVPYWLLHARHSPWSTREEFYSDFESERMLELRFFLEKTVSEQSFYMLERLQKAFRDIVLSCEKESRQAILQQFFEVGKDLHGLYILIDYLNFKHEGTNPKERYNSVGWGLKQVLELMITDEIDKQLPTRKRFILAAKKLLEIRIMNAPEQCKEIKWLQGWYNRLETYQ